MASSNSQVNINNISLVDIDFQSQKTSLKNFLKSQDQFKDYDFDGPNMAVLLDLLSVNTFRNAFFISMGISESHLDSAQLLTSVISNAKDLNYIPRSVRSAEARIRVSFEATGASQPYTVPKGSPFSTIVKNTSYVFTIPETITVSSANTTFEFESDLYEGVFVKDSYVFTSSSTTSRFQITNKNVDTRSIVVTVYEDNAEVGDIYVQKTSLLDLDANSKAYFLQQSSTGHYEIIFGDNIIGKQPKVNSTLLIDYRISSGLEANGSKLFSIDFDPTGSDELSTTPVVTTLQTAQAGADFEDIESIRYYAPRHFQSQNRTVIDVDYEILLKDEFPEINTVSVYGGEELNPPRMGKVAVAIDIAGITGLPDSKKKLYKDFLDRRSVLPIKPFLVSPEYMFVDIRTLVKYNVNITNNSDSRIESLVSSAITTYNKVELNDFKSTFRKTAFEREIDFADISIISNDTKIKYYKKISPVIGSNAIDYIIQYDFAFNEEYPQQVNANINSNKSSTISSSFFTYAGVRCHLRDDGIGNINIVREEGNNDLNVVKIGTVDYSGGIIQLNKFVPEQYEGDAIKIYAEAKDSDVTSERSTILQIESSGINITVERISV